MMSASQFTQTGIRICRHFTALLVLFSIIQIINLSAATSCEASPSSSKSPTNDVRVLIDISGSMKLNDPANLRKPALNLFVSLLPTKTQSGVWTFGQWVNMLIPHGPVTKEWKNSAKNSVQMINSAGLYTNIEDVIRRSTWDWRNSTPEHGTERSLIILTDGIVDISDDDQANHSSRERILQELLPLLQKASVKIHAIALSNESDRNLLEQLTTATGGKFETIETAKGLERLFLHLFEDVAPPDSLPLTENRVKVDDSIKEMTFLIFKENREDECSITSPSGEKYDLSSHKPEVLWHREAHYDLVTVRTPESGYWKINSKIDPDNRVMVVTDLKLLTSKLPGTLYADDKQAFYIHLENNGETIKRQDFLHFVKVSLKQEALDVKYKGKKWKLKISDNGRGIDEQAKDGIYSIEFDKSLIAGEHEIEVTVNGTTFRRIFRKHIIVYDEPATANIEKTSDTSFKVSVLPYETLVDTDSIQVTSIHTLPNGEIKNTQISRISPSEWVQEISSDGLSGNHKVIVKISGTSKSGKNIKSRLSPLTVFIDEKNVTSKENHDHKEVVDNNDLNPSSDMTDDNEISWGMVTLKVGIFNIIIMMLSFSIYKYFPQIRQKFNPNLFEEVSNV